MQTDLLADSIVEEDPKIATKRLRIAAAIIDFFIFGSIGFILGIFFGKPMANIDGIGYELSGFPALIWMLFWLLLIPVSEGLTGQTIGKKCLGINVVKADYNKTTLLNSFMRHFFDIIDLIFLIGLIVAACNKRNQRIVDIVANTIVVTKEK